MKAIVITRPGGPEVLEERDEPRPIAGVGQICVRVRASALNRADLLQRRGRYPPPAGSATTVPGLEYAGEVVDIGPEVQLWAPGDRVMGIVGGGAHAELVRVHEREAIPVPENLGWEDAAAIPEAFLTAHDALTLQLRVRAGEKVLIHAVASGVGTAAVQLARLAGARTYGTSRTAGKLERVRDLGLEIGIDSSRADWVEQLEQEVGEGGIGAIVDLVGGAYLGPNLRLLSPRGRAIVVGTVAGGSTEIDLSLLLRKRLHLMGTVLRSRPLEEKIALAREFTDTVLPGFSTGKLRPVIGAVLPMSHIREAHQLMESNETFGKVVLTEL